ncbi:hypothetical protein OG331_51230 [Streptomyces sp. NBC_01017]|uniref:hypothetical protein n=1 Tax=Streptomyces sp. NBC_01017 TaxID=2903721 RepID=UPI0038639277|nr:hypothetical protein OG331_00740 [Streptomyces sp. NBC_01017]WSV35283.1 hypothetical protein OG331_51230 [Streptomyces sp. NBC_01017]
MQSDDKPINGQHNPSFFDLLDQVPRPPVTDLDKDPGKERIGWLRAARTACSASAIHSSTTLSRVNCDTRRTPSTSRGNGHLQPASADRFRTKRSRSHFPIIGFAKGSQSGLGTGGEVMSAGPGRQGQPISGIGIMPTGGELR